MDYGFTKFLSRAMNDTDFKLNIAYAKIAQRKINLYLLFKKAHLEELIRYLHGLV